MTMSDHHQLPAAAPRAAAAARAAAGRAERRLRSVLRIDAAISITSGAAVAIAAGAVDGLLGTDRPGWVRIVGLACVLFGLDVAWLSRSPREHLVTFAPVVIATNAGWVALSVVTVLLGWYERAGVVAVLAAAVAVDTIGFLQLLAWRELRRTR